MSERDKRRAESIKVAMRERYARATLGPVTDYARTLERALNFWGDYENVNRRLCPDDPVYSVSRAGTAPATTADFWGYISAVAGQCRILESCVQGEATASTVNRWQVQRTTGLFAGGVTITAEKFNSRSPAALGTSESGGTTALTGNPLITHAFNAFGGADRWVALPGEELYMVNGEAIVCRPASGAGTCTGYVVFEEL